MAIVRMRNMKNSALQELKTEPIEAGQTSKENVELELSSEIRVEKDSLERVCDWVRNKEYSTEYTDVYTHPSGNVMLKMFPAPVNYMDENGAAKIDSRIIPLDENTYGVRKSDCKIRLPKHLQNDYISIADTQTEFKLSFGQSFANGEIVEQNTEKVVYNDTVGSVREVSALKSGIMLGCTLKSAEEARNFGFDLFVQKLRWENYSDSTTVFLSKDNLPKITLHTLSLMDAENNLVLPKNNVFLNGKAIRVGVELDEEYLQSAAYPLMLSMSVEIYKNKLPDTTVYSEEHSCMKHQNPVAYLGNTVLGSGIHYLRFRFNYLLHTKAENILSAKYVLHRLDGEKDTVLSLHTLNEFWSSTGLQWENKAALGEKIAEATCENDVYEFDLTDFVKACINDREWKTEVNGLALESENGNIAVVATNDHPLYAPYIEIELNEMPIVKPNCGINPDRGQVNYAGEIAIPKAKLSDELREKMNAATDDELIPVYIFRKEIEKEQLKQNVCEKGFDFDTYEDEAQFEEKIAAPIRERVVKERKAVKKRDFATVEAEEIFEVRENYRMARLHATREVTIANNQGFWTGKFKSRRAPIYVSEYTTTVIAELTKYEIEELLLDLSVEEITFFENLEQECCTAIALDQVRAGYGTTSDYGLKSYGYTGSGIKIGVIEAESGRFDPNCPQLAPLVKSGKLQYVEVNGVSAVNHWHATLVTSIICGQECSVNKRKYEGVVPNAQVYQSAIVKNVDVYKAFDQFVNLGVNLINYSGGSNGYGPFYSDYDKEIDKRISATHIVFVNSAGNNSGKKTEHSDGTTNVVSPAKAYNSVTVGNVDTKSGFAGARYPKYSVFETSSYTVEDYLTNKPEVSAPGTYIGYVDSSNNEKAGTGTSFAAPIVTGIIAQLMQKYGSKINPTFYKALLMVGAEANKINDTTYRDYDGDEFYNKQGAGLVNGYRSAYDINYKNYVWNTGNYNSERKNIYLSAGDKLRVVLVFEKPEDTVLKSKNPTDLELKLLDKKKGYSLVSSLSPYNNFEIIEYTASKSGDYIISIDTYAKSNTNKDFSVSLAWRID